MTVQPEWSFLKLAMGAKARDPMQDEFFQDQSIDGIDHALIRETIQNSLDARAGEGPVKVVISYGKLSADRANYWFPETVQAHFSAKEIGLASLPSWGEEECPFLTIEDFGTKGLEGAVDSEDPERGGNFYHFFRAEGLSNKKDGDRGSWGVGKIVIPRSSRARSFFAITRRASDGCTHLMGQAILRHHQVNGVRYTPDGWFSRNENGLQVPFGDDLISANLNRDFRLKRKNETGLGVVIPWVYDKYFKIERLQSVIAREYFIPILAGQLTIELRDHETDTVKYFDSNSYNELKAADLQDEPFQDAIELAGALLGSLDAHKINVEVISQADEAQPNYDWEKYITVHDSATIERALDQGAIIHFRVPMYIKPSAEQGSQDFFDVIVKRKLGRHYPIYVRDGLIIPNQPTRKKVPDCVSLIHASNSSIADALRRAECPAHTDWKSTRDKFQDKKYVFSNRLISFVRESALKLLDKLVVNEGVSDYNLLADLLPSPTDEPSTRSLPENGSGAVATTKKDKLPPNSSDASDLPLIPPAASRCWRLQQTSGQIALRGNADGFKSESGYIIRLQAAYDLQGRNPFKAHSRFDFDLFSAAVNGVDKRSGFKVESNDDVSITGGDYGSLDLCVHSPDFELFFCPSDLNRDLIIKVSSSPFNGVGTDDSEEGVE